MSGKKNKKRNAKPPQAQVRLSQCMIVKNEEKNIEKALSWAKGIAYEQVVVDTGSTDRTVELAEKMGAKVFHFEWIGDFSAAKNFAIEQASGNWIAFLDADEYFTKKDAKTLYDSLKKIRADEELREKVFALNVPLVNVDDDGKPVSVYDQERVFRNFPSIRYEGKIHEVLTLKEEHVFRTNIITIIHTGYAKSVFAETGKAGRNIEMLKVEQLERPDDMYLKSYLADAYRVQGDPESLAEAERLYLEVTGAPAVEYEAIKKGAYLYLIETYLDEGAIAAAEPLSIKSLSEYPEDIDLNFFYATILNRKHDYREALKILVECEERLVKAKSLDAAQILMAKPKLLFKQLAVASQGLRDLPGLVRYATMVLEAERNNTDILAPYISELIVAKTPENEIRELLSQVYDFKNPQDLLIIARAAKTCGAVDFARAILAEAGAMMGKK